MCEYCDLKNYDWSIRNEPEMILKKRGETTLVIEYHPNFREWWLYAYEQNSVCVQIYHCPFCGRKLEEEE